jgi:hypothetical protein
MLPLPFAVQVDLTRCQLVSGRVRAMAWNPKIVHLALISRMTRKTFSPALQARAKALHAWDFQNQPDTVGLRRVGEEPTRNAQGPKKPLGALVSEASALPYPPRGRQQPLPLSPQCPSHAQLSV